MGRLSQAIAMDLRYHLYASDPRAVRYTYPNGRGTAPVPVAYTEEERADNTRRRDEVLAEWKATDPVGYQLWDEAMERMRAGDESDLADGWAALTLEDGVRIVDPCRYCRECRSRR